MLMKTAKIVLALTVSWSTSLAAETKPNLQHVAAAPSIRPLASSEYVRTRLEPRQHLTIAAEVGARIDRIAVEEGGAFKAGQVLISFDCSLQEAQLRLARAEQAFAAASHQVKCQLAQSNAVDRLALEQARAAEQKSSAETTLHQAAMSKCSITAPFDGRVVERKVTEHAFVQPGQPLLETLDDTAFELRFQVPVRWLSWLRPESRLQVFIDDTGKSYPVRFIGRRARVDEASESVKVLAAIDGAYPELLAGMSGLVMLETPPMH